MRWVSLTAAATSVFALGVGLSLVPANTPQTIETTSAEIPAFLDPAAMARSSCGGLKSGVSAFLRPNVRLAMAAHAEEAEPVDEPPPLWEGLGDAHMAVTTANQQAQAYFDQGLRLLYGFNHWEAIRAFRHAQSLDPACAMCYWGEARALGPNINAPMEPAAMSEAVAAVSEAERHAGNATPLEQALISAMAKRYSNDAEADRAEMDRLYADAMSAVYESHADNHDVAVLYAESLMDLAPWDYWERDLRTPHPHIAKAIAAVERVLEVAPDHAGAIHLYIHLMESSVLVERAEPHADRLAALAPGAGHLVHMPGHIYFRVGRYIDSLNTNVNAVAVDEAYLQSVKGGDIYRYGYYPHNVHFVLVSAQMAGDGETAMAAAGKLDTLIPEAALEVAPWLSHPVKAAPLFAAAQFASLDSVMELSAPPTQYPYLRAMWHYVRGLSLAAAGRTADAAAEAEAIVALMDAPGMAVLVDNGMPGPDILKVAELTLRGRIADADGDTAAAIQHLEAASAGQRALPYMEPPFWYYPVDQTLGAVLLKAGRAEDAADAFTASLALHPNNAWSLYGLMKAQEALGDPAASVTAELYRKASLKPELTPAMDRL